MEINGCCQSGNLAYIVGVLKQQKDLMKLQGDMVTKLIESAHVEPIKPDTGYVSNSDGIDVYI